MSYHAEYPDRCSHRSGLGRVCGIRHAKSAQVTARTAGHNTLATRKSEQPLTRWRPALRDTTHSQSSSDRRYRKAELALMRALFLGRLMIYDAERWRSPLAASLYTRQHHHSEKGGPVLRLVYDDWPYTSRSMSVFEGRDPRGWGSTADWSERCTTRSVAEEGFACRFSG